MNYIHGEKAYFTNKFKIIDCAGGAAHTIALTEEGYIFGWGQNDKNQLNLGKIECINKPYLLLIYELDNNLTIDEYKFLESQSKENSEENPNINIDNNRFKSAKNMNVNNNINDLFSGNNNLFFSYDFP